LVLKSYSLKKFTFLILFKFIFLTQMENSIAMGKPVHCERWGNSTPVPKTWNYHIKQFP
jgi:hypothetical protein